jgi:hypothetical protein
VIIEQDRPARIYHQVGVFHTAFALTNGTVGKLVTFTEAFVFGSVAGTLRGVLRVYAYLNDSHLLSWGMAVNIKEQVYYGTEVYAFSFHDVEQTKEIIFGEYVNLCGCKKVV